MKSMQRAEPGGRRREVDDGHAGDAADDKRVHGTKGDDETGSAAMQAETTANSTTTAGDAVGRRNSLGTVLTLSTQHAAKQRRE